MNPPKKNYAALVAEAESQVETLTIEQAKEALGDGAALVDLRDIRELQHGGKIPGAVHAPRGMLEFWVDPSSPYHREALSAPDSLILYCSLGWRSALAAKSLLDMGFENVGHLGGGFEAWKAAGEPVEEIAGQ